VDEEVLHIFMGNFFQGQRAAQRVLYLKTQTYDEELDHKPLGFEVDQADR